MSNSIRLRDLPAGYVACCGIARCLAAYPTCPTCGKPAPGGKAVPATGQRDPGAGTDTDPGCNSRKGPSRARKWAPYRSYTEQRAAEYLTRRYHMAIGYERLRVKIAEGAWYTPDFLRPSDYRLNETVPIGVAYEVKNAAHDCRNSLATQRRVLRVAAERLAELGIELRLLVWDGKVFTEQEV